MPITTEQITQLAPDASAAAAGKKLMALKHWSELGASAEVLWGKCQGSALYQVKVDLTNLGSSCSCPSRKFPCKHALGLLYLVAESPSSVPMGKPPEWVEEWFVKRRERAEKKAERDVEQSRKPVDEKAQQKRAEQRETRVSEGLERLDLWIRDLIRQGLAGLESKPPSLWDEQARRLVDAQAPGLSSRLLALGEIPGSAPNWPTELLAELGLIKLLILAWQRHEQLDESLRSEVRHMIGWSLSQEEFAQRTDGVVDHWCVVGQTAHEEKQLQVQRSWLLGRTTRKWALIVQFATGGQPFADRLPVGTERRGTLLYFPGAAEQRAKLMHSEGSVSEFAERLPGTNRFEGFLHRVALQLARQPWNCRACEIFTDVTVVPRERGWVLRDETGAGLPLAASHLWRLLAMTGGTPCDLAAEWDGRRLHPLAIATSGRYRAL